MSHLAIFLAGPGADEHIFATDTTSSSPRMGLTQASLHGKHWGIGSLVMCTRTVTSLPWQLLLLHRVLGEVYPKALLAVDLPAGLLSSPDPGRPAHLVPPAQMRRGFCSDAFGSSVAVIDDVLLKPRVLLRCAVKSQQQPSLVWHDAPQHTTPHHSTSQHNKTQHIPAQHYTARRSTAYLGPLFCGGVVPKLLLGLVRVNLHCPHGQVCSLQLHRLPSTNVLQYTCQPFESA